MSTQIPAAQFSSVAQWCLTHCNPMNCSMPGLPVYHQLPEFAQTHVHWVSDAIQPSHPLSSLSPAQPFPASGSFQMSQPFTSGGETKCLDFSFLNIELQDNFSLSSFTFIRRLFSSPSLSAVRAVLSEYLRLLTFLPAFLIPASASSSPAFLMMYSAYKLNKQGDNNTALTYSFSYLEPVCCSMSSSNCCFLTCI